MLEAIVAIGIITTAISSSLTLVQGSIRAEGEAQSAVIAANLGREAVEVVRAIRDSNRLSGAADFDEGLKGPSFDYTGIPVFDVVNGTWSIDFTVEDIAQQEAIVYRQTSADGPATLGLYRQAMTQPAETIASSFRRLVTLNALCDDGIGGVTVATSGSGCGGAGIGKIGIQVLVDLSWQLPGRSRRQTIEERLFDWR